jgi:hypothetical protein
MPRNNRNSPIIMNGATAGSFRLFVIGAVTQGNCQMVWTSEGIPQLQSRGFKTHSHPVDHCLNCGQLRTDEWGWGPNSEGGFCSLQCQRDFHSKNSRRRLKGRDAREAQRFFWRYDAVCGVNQATGELFPMR